MFNLMLQMQRRNPYPAYWLMRRAQPLVHINSFDLWLVSRYDDAKRVLTDYANFSSDFRRMMASPELSDPEVRASLITSDPPIHTKLRNLVTRAFTPRAVANLEPRIERLTHEMLDQVIESGRMDLIQELAYPLPVIVIAEMLGIPAQDRPQFKQWSDEVVASADRIFTDKDGLDASTETDMPPEVMQYMGPYFHDIIEARRAAPRDDLISGLVAAEIEGERLTERDLLSFCSLLLVAGNVTTTNLIGNAMLALLQHPHALEELRRDLSLLPGAIEEALRYRSPVQFMFRVATGEVELGGQMIHAGDRVIALIGSANRDETKFPRAQQYDIRRNPNPHIAFGHGIHYCLGAPLARLEGRVALTAVLQRLHDLKRVGIAPLEPTTGILVHGVKNLPVRFTPGARHLFEENEGAELWTSEVARATPMAVSKYS